MNNLERRDEGMVYISDEEIFKEQRSARKIVYQFNHHDTDDFEGLKELVNRLIDAKDGGAFVNPPFYCDYGSHIHVGKNFFANYNCTILDVAPVRIGDNCQMAPNVAIYTAGHPVHPDTRNSGYEYGIPVTIGDNVWIGGNTVICPGVTIGNNVVIGAGSVVTKDIPDNWIVAGNPCKPIRQITDDDRRAYFRRQHIDDEAWKNICEKNGWEE